AAAKNAQQPPHKGTGPAAAALAAAAAAEGSALAAADPLAATLAATEAADFPVTVPPAAVTPQQQQQLQQFSLEPQWLLGKGLGALLRPRGLGGPPSELAAFAAAGWAADMAPLQQLPHETAAAAAARRLQAATVRMFAAADPDESPLQFKQRMQQLLQQAQEQQLLQDQQPELQQLQQQQQQQQEQEQDLPSSPAAAAAAAALQLQQQALKAQLPVSVRQLLSRYAHMSPKDFSLKGSIAENAELRAIRAAIEEAEAIHATERYQQLLAATGEDTEAAAEEPAAAAAETAAAAADGTGAAADGTGAAAATAAPDAKAAAAAETKTAAAAAAAAGKLGGQEGGVAAAADLLERRRRAAAATIERAGAALAAAAAERLGPAAAAAAAAAAGCCVYPGLLVKGRVQRVLQQAAIIDIGVSVDALLLAADVWLPLERCSSSSSSSSSRNLRLLLQQGDTIHCVVSKVSSKSLRVSLLPLRQVAAWGTLMRAAKTRETLPALTQQLIPGELAS
ncbi:30S ribosomal protein S1, putative, partial [Eimeria tenella]